MSVQISNLNNEEVNNDVVNSNVKIVMSQTNYNEEQSIEKLKQFNNDYLKVIRDYLGIPEKKETKIKSVNQEIFKQIRTTLDCSMKQYRDKNPVDVNQVIENLKESDEREKQKMKK